MLNLSELDKDTPEDVVVAWGHQYREARNAGAESKEAAVTANTWLESQLAGAAE